MDQIDIPKRMAAYLGKVSAEPNHRYRSWEHCFRFFRAGRREVSTKVDSAALQLAFYLASWGMYRGSSFLLQRDYTVHRPTVDLLCSKNFAPLWERQIGQSADDDQYAPLILQAADAVRDSYAPFGNASDTLVTKVLLGTFACLPACDRFFIDGFKQSGHQYSYVNALFIKRMIDFCARYAEDLRLEQSKIALVTGLEYPIMKLADMYFWQIGFEAAGAPVEIKI